MAKVTPDEFQEKHARRLKGATEDIRRGIAKVTVAPTAQAAAKQEKMKARLMAKIDDGTWAARLKAVTLTDWQSAATNVGIGRIAQGIDNAAPKVIAFAQQLLPAVDAAKAKIEGMPDLTLEDSINRMSSFIREMGKFRKK